jgi:predicted ferric reductase
MLPAVQVYRSSTTDFMDRDYFIATGVLFAGSWLHRQIRIYFEHGTKHHAELCLAQNGFIQVTVPTKARWRVGQHFFVRFLTLGMHAWTIHPFTACSLPALHATDAPMNELLFLIRPRGGFTSRLANFLESHANPRMRVLLDGPYGGVDMRKIEASQRMLVIAGGSGAGWTLPFILAFLRKATSSKDGATARPSLRIVLATRDSPTKHWYESEVRRLLGDVSKELKSAVGIEIYTTATEDPQASGQFLQRLDEPEKIRHTPEEKIQDISGNSSQEDLRSLHDIRHFEKRPDLSAIIRHEASSIEQDQSLGIFVSSSVKHSPATSQSLR